MIRKTTTSRQKVLTLRYLQVLRAVRSAHAIQCGRDTSILPSLVPTRSLHRHSRVRFMLSPISSCRRLLAWFVESPETVALSQIHPSRPLGFLDSPCKRLEVRSYVHQRAWRLTVCQRPSALAQQVYLAYLHGILYHKFQEMSQLAMLRLLYPVHQFKQQEEQPSLTWSRSD